MLGVRRSKSYTPFKMMVLSQVVNGIVLPFILIFMVLLINKREIMGDYTNGRVWNAVSWITIFLVILLTLFMMFTLF